MRQLFKVPLVVLMCIGLITVLVIATPLDSVWAHAYAGSLEQPTGDILIVLSAASDDEGVISYSSYWRARYALRAWQTGSFRSIVISGEGVQGIRDFLVAEGVPQGAIIIDGESKSTRDNGIHTAKLIRAMPGVKVLLTSDFHMFRALRVFRKVGLDVVPYPAPDVIKSSQHWYGRFSGFETLVLETVKIMDYEVRGWM